MVRILDIVAVGGGVPLGCRVVAVPSGNNDSLY